MVGTVFDKKGKGGAIRAQSEIEPEMREDPADLGGMEFLVLKAVGGQGEPGGGLFDLRAGKPDREAAVGGSSISAAQAPGGQAVERQAAIEEAGNFSAHTAVQGGEEEEETS